uniref:Uncharacterized protein n=1 Tax=Cacopsylla melanoneura TaxID=428564 RepID=A0A8D9FEQ9_9HEMI
MVIHVITKFPGFTFWRIPKAIARRGEDHFIDQIASKNIALTVYIIIIIRCKYFSKQSLQLSLEHKYISTQWPSKTRSVENFIVSIMASTYIFHTRVNNYTRLEKNIA